MDLIQTMQGEFNGSEFGNSMASIDFNADGYDDLVVCSDAWNPSLVYKGMENCIFIGVDQVLTIFLTW
jgi:hypothetical protein